MLVLVGKVLQNLSNGLNFGAKESYMVKLNDFIDSNQANVYELFDDLSSEPEPLTATWDVPERIYNQAALNVYHFVDEHLVAILESLRNVESDDPTEVQRCKQSAMVLGSVMDQIHHQLEENPEALSSLASVFVTENDIFADPSTSGAFGGSGDNGGGAAPPRSALDSFVAHQASGGGGMPTGAFGGVEMDSMA